MISVSTMAIGDHLYEHPRWKQAQLSHHEYFADARHLLMKLQTRELLELRTQLSLMEQTLLEVLDHAAESVMTRIFGGVYLGGAGRY